MPLPNWLEERRQNCLRIAKTKHGEDRQGWLEDARYFGQAVAAVKSLSLAHGDRDPNVPLRMHIALRLLRAWNDGTAGYSADVVHVVNEWLDGGMKGPIPWPDNPFFAEWAQQNGYCNIGGAVGFRFFARMVGPQ